METHIVYKCIVFISALFISAYVYETSLVEAL